VPATARVFYGDLDLKTAAGARVMWLRISQAASNACGRPRTDLLPRTAVETHRCRMQILSRSVTSLDAPLVTAEFARTYPVPATLTAER
jgi:UrcA family protein